MTGNNACDQNTRSREAVAFPWVFLAVAVAILGLGGLYFHDLGGWLVEDDEGTDLYEVWRISEGDVPGVDLITEQPPVFLLGGVVLGLLSDFNVAVLRGISVALVLGSAWLVFLLGREIWGPRAGCVATVFYLLNHLVYTQARLFRPDPWMLAFSVLGLYLFVLAQTRLFYVTLDKLPSTALGTGRTRRLYLLLAGVVYGLGTLCKLFGVLPLGGCLLFIVCQAVAGRASVARALEDAGLLVGPFLLVSLGGLLAFYPPGSTYYDQVLGQHLRLGSGMGLLYRIEKGLVYAALFLGHNLAFLFAVPLLRRFGVSRRSGERVLAWQVPSGLAYFALSRPVYERYWLYLVPVFALILGYLVDRALAWIGSKWLLQAVLAGALLVGLGIAQSVPIILRQTGRHEEDTLALAAYIAAHTAPGEHVLSDYAGLNFHARRPSVYQASIIAWGRITGGFVTGADLIAEIEERDVKMILLHVPGGDLSPSHLIHLRDFDAFYAYLNRRFCRMGTFDRAGQLFEVYQVCPG
jgi:4-amino-4-deoxy-L-arabinose transferase-like glycosyltransferase